MCFEKGFHRNTMSGGIEEAVLYPDDFVYPCLAEVLGPPVQIQDKVSKKACGRRFEGGDLLTIVHEYVIGYDNGGNVLLEPGVASDHILCSERVFPIEAF